MAGVNLSDKMANLQGLGGASAAAPNLHLTADGKITTAGWIHATITHSILKVRAEKTYDPEITGEKLKEKLYMIVGTKPAYMKLELRSTEDETKIIGEIGDKQKLSSCPIGKGNIMRIHVVDQDPQKSVLEFTDVSKVKKFEISDENYDKRNNTFRKWAKQNLKGHYEKKQQEREQKAEAEKKLEDKEKEVAGKIKVGERCQLGSNTEFPRRGEVMYVGVLNGKPGTWVGVKLDEPYGKNNGTFEGKEYFKCMPKCGVFTRPSAVEVGDFPEEDLFDEL